MRAMVRLEESKLRQGFTFRMGPHLHGFLGELGCVGERHQLHQAGDELCCAVWHLCSLLDWVLRGVQKNNKISRLEQDKTKNCACLQTHMQHELGVSVDEFDQSEEEALVASSVKFCCFLFEFKAGGHSFECQTLWRGGTA